jgi:hypothetical protein
MPTAIIRLPRLVNFWMTATGALFVAGRLVPEYRYIFDGLGSVSAGPLICYLSVTISGSEFKAVNELRPPFLRIPEAGRHVRMLTFAFGICVCLLGVAVLLGLTPP